MIGVLIHQTEVRHIQGRTARRQVTGKKMKEIMLEKKNRGTSEFNGIKANA